MAIEDDDSWVASIAVDIIDVWKGGGCLQEKKSTQGKAHPAGLRLATADVATPPEAINYSLPLSITSPNLGLLIAQKVPTHTNSKPIST